MKRFHLPLAAALLLAAASLLRADTTLRYTITWKTDGMVPASMLSMSAMTGSSTPALPPEFVLRLQGARGRVDGGLAPEIVDLTQSQITLLDPARQRFATATMQEYEAQLASQLGAAARSPLKFSGTIASHKTGRTDTILGIQAEETAVTLNLTLDLPDPSGAAAAALGGSVARLELQVWTALPSEYARVASLQQVLQFGQAQSLLFNPLAGESSILDHVPAALRDDLSTVAATLGPAHAVTLRLHGALYMPMLAGLLQAAKAANPNPSANAKSALASMDPAAPLGEVDLMASELSDAPLDAALFAPPAGYQPEPLADLMKALRPAPPKRAELSGLPGAGAAPPRGRRLPPLPDVPKLDPGQPLADAQRDWLAAYAGQSSREVVADSHFGALLQALAPPASFHMGVDMPLAAAMDSVLHGPANPVLAMGDRWFISAHRTATGRGQAFLWVDARSGAALGGVLLFYNSNRPSPALTLFSSQIGKPVSQFSQLPASFLRDFEQWSVAQALPATPATYFIDHDGETSVVFHPPLACSRSSAALCEARNNDAADTDMQAAYFLLQQRFPTGAAAAEIATEQQGWLAQRPAACAAPPQGESPLACRARLTRERARALVAMTATPAQP